MDNGGNSVGRISIVALFFSALGMGALFGFEGWVSVAAPPVPGDVATYAAGNTTRPDGKPVKTGDKITPPEGIALVVRDVTLKEKTLKACMPGKLHQHEYDAYTLLAYNVGANRVCNSSIPGKVAREQYEEACKTILDFKKVQGRDCSAPENKRFCGGVWTRRNAEYRMCMGAS